MKGDRQQGTAEGRSSACRLASLSALSIPGRNECAGPNCSLMVTEEREKTVPAKCATVFEVKEKAKKKTVWQGHSESERRRREEKWQACWCCRDQRRAYRMVQAFAEKLEHTGPVKNESAASGSQSKQLAWTPEPPLPKRNGTEPSVHFITS